MCAGDVWICHHHTSTVLYEAAEVVDAQDKKDGVCAKTIQIVDNGSWDLLAALIKYTVL